MHSLRGEHARVLSAKVVKLFVRHPHWHIVKPVRRGAPVAVYLSQRITVALHKIVNRKHNNYLKQSSLRSAA